MKTLVNVKLILGKVNDLVDKIAANLAWMMLLAITLLNIAQVFYRYVLNNALSWSEEASLWMMVWITFIILPLAYRRGLNISMMFFRDKLGRNRIEFLIRCLFHLIVIVVSVVCFYYAVEMCKSGSRIELPALEVSKVWVYAVMPPAWILLILAAVEGIFIDFPGIIDPAGARDNEDALAHELSEEAAL
jgi:TRAP-type C4-dicarboxylate transport system permease small subunit